MRSILFVSILILSLPSCFSASLEDRVLLLEQKIKQLEKNYPIISSERTCLEAKSACDSYKREGLHGFFYKYSYRTLKTTDYTYLDNSTVKKTFQHTGGVNTFPSRYFETKEKAQGACEVSQKALEVKFPICGSEEIY